MKQYLLNMVSTQLLFKTCFLQSQILLTEPEVFNWSDQSVFTTNEDSKFLLYCNLEQGSPNHDQSCLQINQQNETCDKKGDGIYRFELDAHRNMTNDNARCAAFYKEDVSPVYTSEKLLTVYCKQN